MSIQRLSGFTNEGGVPIDGDPQSGDVVLIDGKIEHRWYPPQEQPPPEIIPPEPSVVDVWNAIQSIQQTIGMMAASQNIQATPLPSIGADIKV